MRTVKFALPAALMIVLPAFAAPDLGVALPHRPSDGYADVRRANIFGAQKRTEEGRAFIAKLRALPAENRNLEERQSVDMAEYAFLRHDTGANKARCIECLKAVYDSCPTSFWGWAAFSFLKEYGEDVLEPRKDPLRGLGPFGDGVVNLVPRMLEKAAAPDRNLSSDLERIMAATNDVQIADLSGLKPGSLVRRAILRKRLVEICGADKIGEVLSSEGGAALFARLWKDDAVLEDFLLSGPVFSGPKALEVLMTLFLNDSSEQWSKTEIGRRVTVAVALNAKAGDDLAATVRHWAAFRRIAEVDGFLKEAASNDCREWRFVVTRPRDSAETLYLNSRRHFPTRNFYRLINNVPYRRTNCFGASKFRKFGKHMKAWEGYMRPWDASGLSRLYLRSRIGGVCVEQSKWAAYAANSQGLMAVTGGQPGRRATKFRPKAPPHLSWVLRGANGNWRVLNNIRPYTHSVFSIWGSDFQHLLSVERAFADREAHDESELLLFAGRTREAAMRCPYNYTAWRAYADGFRNGGASIAQWQRYLAELLELQPEGRQVTWDFAHEALDAMAKKGMAKNELAKETAKVFMALPQPKVRVAEEMNFRKKALMRALRHFKDHPELEDKLLGVAFEANKESPAYLPQIFGHVLARLGKDKERLGRFFSVIASIGRSAEADAPGTVDWRRIFTMADFSSDREAFRMIANFRDESDPPAGAAKVPLNDYGAALASDDALVVVSSRGKGDTPEDHPRVTDATPYDPKRKGLLTTKAQKAPWVTVELAGLVKLSGITVDGAGKGMAIWISDDGEQWSKIAECGKDNPAWRVDLRKDAPSGKLVKLGYEPGEKRKVLAIRKILVYGNRQY